MNKEERIAYLRQNLEELKIILPVLDDIFNSIKDRKEYVEIRMEHLSTNLKEAEKEVQCQVTIEFLEKEAVPNLRNLRPLESSDESESESEDEPQAKKFKRGCRVDTKGRRIDKNGNRI